MALQNLHPRFKSGRRLQFSGGLFRRHFRTEGILDRLEAARLVVEVAEIVVHEGNEPDVLGDLLDPDILAGKDLTEVDLPALVADPAAVGEVAVQSCSG
jgi:hypothetical protein